MKSCFLRLLLIWMPNKAESICRKLGEKLRRPVLDTCITPCGTKSARIARRNTLTDSYIRFLLKTQPFLTFVTRTPKSNSYIITFPKYTVLIHWWIVYANLLLCWSTPCFITLLSETSTKSHCWSIPNLNITPYLFTWLRKSQFQYIAELYPMLTHRLDIPNFITLLR